MKNCPILWVLSAADIGAILLATASWARPSLAECLNPVVIGWALAVALAGSVELHRIFGGECPYASQGVLFRLSFYFVAWVTFILLFIICSYRHPLLLVLLIALVAALTVGVALHLLVDHSAAEFGTAPIWLVSLGWFSVVVFLTAPIFLIVIRRFGF